MKITVTTGGGGAPGRETRSLVLGHLQRGGSPVTADRVLAQRLGCSATRILFDSADSGMVAVRGGEIRLVPFSQLVGEPRKVDASSDLIRTGRELNLCFGDEPAGAFLPARARTAVA